MPKKKPAKVLIAESDAMKQVVSSIEEFAANSAPIMIEGEPGTGRELIARIIHKTSPRRQKELVSIRAGAGPKAIFVDEIEGSSNSAFRNANGGTLMVKNLPELTRMSQRKLTKLLRVAETEDTMSGYDVRIVGTTDPDIEASVKAELFNPDLFNRLSAQRIVVPPLRDRVADIAPLAAQLVQLYTKELSLKRIRVSTRAYDALIMYPWPGNVAELKSVVRRLVVRAKRSRIEPGDVNRVLPLVAVRVPMEEMSFEDMVRSKLRRFLCQVDGYDINDFHDEVISRVERPLFSLVLEHTRGNQVKAAEILGLNRNTLRRKLTERGVDSKPAKPAKRAKSK